jgi:hypothetical protein
MQRMIAALAIGLLTCSRVTADDAGEKTGVPAISADTFLSSQGVNTHVDQGYNAGSYVVPLRYLGVRNIRDSARNLSAVSCFINKPAFRSICWEPM